MLVGHAPAAVAATVHVVAAAALAASEAGQAEEVCFEKTQVRIRIQFRHLIMPKENKKSYNSRTSQRGGSFSSAPATEAGCGPRSRSLRIRQTEVRQNRFFKYIFKKYFCS